MESERQITEKENLAIAKPACETSSNPFTESSDALNKVGPDRAVSPNSKDLAFHLEGALKGLVLKEHKASSRNVSENSRSSRTNRKGTTNFSENSFEPSPTFEHSNKIEDETMKPPTEEMSDLGLNLLFSDSPPKERPRQQDIANLIEIDTNFINFGSFYPGKIFKCNLCLKNLTNHKRAVCVSVDSTTAQFNKEDLLRTSLIGPLPASLSYPMSNSEQIYHSWYFMMPPSKAFEKVLFLTLPPRASVQIGVVIKSPCIPRTEKFFSLVQVTLSNEDPMANLLDNGKHSLIALSQAEVITPKLECCRELLHETTKLNIIPLVIKLEGAVQRLRIPFRNGGNRDLDLLLNIIKFPTAAGKPEPEPLAEYHCLPGAIKILANSMSFITIGVSQCGGNKKPGQREQRVLIAKVKDTLMMYSYILDCCFIP